MLKGIKGWERAVQPGFPVDYGYPNDDPVWRGVTPSCV